MLDNLNTHGLASLSEAFPPDEAQRQAPRLAFYSTPPHGSWSNVAEAGIELRILDRQCLDRRIPDKDTLVQEVSAWESRRNAHRTAIEWRFTTADARIKLARLYPSL